ncbi:hypothetical protein [Sphingomonas sp. IW22]|uniref:hypothetical protein n=1 Tax=Sphingomonas sp. IW22 TaxID=3242489 RepID=UPI003522B868
MTLDCTPRQLLQHHAMFDWSDLLLLLPFRVFMALFAIFCALVAAAILWAKYG